MSEKESTPLLYMKSGYAKVELLAVKNEIDKWISLGYTRASIYRHLHHAGKITMHYKTFAKYLQNFEASKKRIPGSLQPRSSTATLPAEGGEENKTGPQILEISKPASFDNKTAIDRDELQ